MNKLVGVVPDQGLEAASSGKLYYGGKWHPSADGGQIQVHNPANLAHLANVEQAGATDLDSAVTAAKAGQGEWKKTKPLHRTQAIREAARRIRENKAELALLDAMDSGNPLKGMAFDVELGATLMEFFAGLATEIKGDTIPSGEGQVNYVTREPVGVVARLVPFNHPLMFACAKIAAPIVAGNAVILKPSEETPLSALRMAELIGDLFPAGVLNVLNGGRELGEAITRHPGIANVSLIGSVNTGKAVMQGAASTLKRMSLELGGKNALIVFPDADVDGAIAGAVKGMNLGWTAGQSCGSTSRVLVHDDHYEALVEGIGEAFEAVRLGDPARADTEMGCLSSRSQFDKVNRYVALAREEGARQVAGGDAGMQGQLANGCFVRPTLFADVTPQMRIAREEVFGPVLSVLKWSDYEEMIETVNGVELGLTASIWTRNLDTALRTVADIHAGYVWVNNSSDHFLGAPFGGVGQSGIGREECLEELLSYTEQKNVNITIAPGR
ncbi:MAG: aldehyde dehydrogenase family protein [Pseudomonadota bacterium]|nr:aldehyde dehydrogenase family protein [Pseudomonadota bacterium]